MRRWIGVLAALALGAGLVGCDSETPTEDAGTDAFVATGVVMTVTAATAAEAVGGVSAGDGFQYYVLDVTFEARGVGPISVAPNALMLTLEGNPSRVNANFRTGEITDGCRARRWSRWTEPCPAGRSSRCRPTRRRR